KKGEGDLTLNFIRDNDILQELGTLKKQTQTLIGFAAESNDIEENALRKLEKKNLDYIVANDITSKDTGFGSDDNRVIIYSKDNKKISLEKMSKIEVAKSIFDVVLKKR
ncbi:MAG: phosphopantothenoylcysteine decarboxylase, partial [Clostridium sp.]